MSWKLSDTAKAESKFVSTLRGLAPVDEATATQVVACFAAAAEDDALAGSLEGWAPALQAAAADCGFDDLDDEVAEEVVARLVRAEVILPSSPGPDPTPSPGAHVVAVLEEDGEWHDAMVREVLGEGRYVVVFTEWGKPQEVAAEDLLSLEAVAPDDDDEGPALGRGACELCARVMPLTFHHLIPKETHGKYLGKALPAGVEGAPTRDFLNAHGMRVCRPCHDQIHRLAPNAVLAERFNTRERVREDPRVEKYVAYAARQRVRGTHA